MPGDGTDGDLVGCEMTWRGMYYRVLGNYIVWRVMLRRRVIRLICKAAGREVRTHGKI